MRRNTRLYHTPAILLTADTDYAGADEAFARGASDILSDNASNDEMRDRVMALASERRRRRLAKARLEACRLPSLLDNDSDLYNERFGRVHLQSLMDHAAARLEPMSLIMLGVSAPQEAGMKGFAKATNQFAGMLRHCVRAEDFVVRLAQDRFLIALPNTPQTEAKMVSNRVSAIAECTAYEGADPLKPFRLELSPSIEDAAGETSAEALIEQMVRRSNVLPFSSAKTG
jgi:two-component system cell cycle response regulator PopA